jgi:dTDP-4-amino-4,6-dideoxygalactose transaminase
MSMTSNENAAAVQSVSNDRLWTKPFPFLDLAAQYATIRDEVNQSIARVMESQHFILGPEVKALEKEVAKYTACNFGIGCASGSDALLLALMAFEIGPGDEVITSPFTFVATGGSIARLGARPVFVDIDPATFNLDPAKLEGAFSDRTKAVLPVHLFGLMAEMAPIMELAKHSGVPVIEDCAQAIGAQYQEASAGSMGAIGCFSFFPSKNLGGAGDGGMMTTNDAALADRLQVLRTHGSRTKYDYELLGMNSRLDALQAAILRVKLPHLDRWSMQRQRHAARYRELFQEFELMGQVELPIVPSGCTHIYNQYVIRVKGRDALSDHLKKSGIPTEVYYPKPLHLQRAFSYLDYKEGDFPNSELASRQVIALPVYPEMVDEQLEAVVGTIANFYREGN